MSCRRSIQKASVSGKLCGFATLFLVSLLANPSGFGQAKIYSTDGGQNFTEHLTASYLADGKLASRTNELTNKSLSFEYLNPNGAISKLSATGGIVADIQSLEVVGGTTTFITFSRWNSAALTNSGTSSLS